MTSTSTRPALLGTPVSSPERPIWMQVRGLRKTFGQSVVLDDVDLEVRAGEIHALVGQNGSGKSTLIKILSGLYPADGGTVTISGKPLTNPVRPPELRAHGLAFVHQNLGLVDECSVVENIRLGQFSARRVSRRIDWRADRSAAAQTLAGMHSYIDPARLVSTLTPAEKGIVAVGRALQGLVPGTGCIVFDESTRAIPREVLPDFYAIVRKLAASGTAIIIVSHRLDEVLAVADRVTVLRDGSVVAGGRPTVDLTESSLAHLMLGRELTTVVEHRPAPAHPDGAAGARSAPVLRARKLALGPLQDLDLDLVRGEVVGVTGATGSGYSEVPFALSGADPVTTGRLEINNQRFDLPVRNPRDIIDAGVALAPEDRASAGLALDLPAQHNLSLPRTRSRGRFMLFARWQTSDFHRAVALLGIVPAEPNLNCASFSGGNQQKLMLAKWLLNEPQVLVLHEPTQAVDVGARADILRAIRAAAAQGVAIVIASSESQDLAAVCDRVVVFRNGSKYQELTNNLTPSAITEATYSTATTEATPQSRPRTDEEHKP